MNWKSHTLIGILFMLIIIYIYNISFFSKKIIILFISTFIFSLLPDIDHSKSHISQIFTYFSLLIIGLGIYEFFFINKLGFIKIILGISLIMYHFKIAINSPHHRQFPHSFTFGIFCSSILGIYTELFFGIISFLSFTLHLTADKFLFKAIKKDIKFWKKILFIK